MFLEEVSQKSNIKRHTKHSFNQKMSTKPPTFTLQLTKTLFPNNSVEQTSRNGPIKSMFVTRTRRFDRFTHSQILQDPGFRPSFPGLVGSCRSAATVRQKPTGEKGVELLLKPSARRGQRWETCWPSLVHTGLQRPLGWRCNASDQADSAEALTEDVQQSAWTQNVVASTRYSAGQQPSLQDLVITNRRHFVDQVIINAPLGHSDHCVMTFDFICYWVRTPEHQTWIRNVCRADFSGMHILFQQAKLGPASVEDICRTIFQKVHEADAMFVPKKPTRSRMSRRPTKRIRRLWKRDDYDSWNSNVGTLQMDVDAASSSRWTGTFLLVTKNAYILHSEGTPPTPVMHGEKGLEDITRLDAKKELGPLLSSDMSFSLHHEKSA
ncbi:hypothetical protein CLF_108873 [Clonorchis sinensis]|uniref:Endonuclease/exonuclease/phosphatase domain-containing protein n=1 Tax=Clonorchis sinensis TaxID=79923 RepID=G7YIP1_CLOSI|nr:hypothetical protein CLF_108873 [Clonorchis sinensis]